MKKFALATALLAITAGSIFAFAESKNEKKSHGVENCCKDNCGKDVCDPQDCDMSCSPVSCR